MSVEGRRWLKRHQPGNPSRVAPRATSRRRGAGDEEDVTGVMHGVRWEEAMADYRCCLGQRWTLQAERQWSRSGRAAVEGRHSGPERADRDAAAKGRP